MNAVTDVNKDAPDSRQLTRSKMCFGRIPSGPPDEPAGKDRRARMTSSSDTCKAVIEEGSGRGLELRLAGGCLSRSLEKVSSLITAGLSSEQRILTAALMLPSSIFAEIVEASDAEEYGLLDDVEGT